MCAAQSEAECGCSGVDWTPVEVYSLREDVNRLERENAALRQDKERLDWLLEQVNDGMCFECCDRAVIDEAMKSTK
jgi:hypothetical protein